jgi:hypothetical protein
MFAGPNTVFKPTTRKQRLALFKAGNNHMQVYKLMIAYKLGNAQIFSSPPTAPPDGQVKLPASALGPYQPHEN